MVMTWTYIAPHWITAWVKRSGAFSGSCCLLSPSLIGHAEWIEVPPALPRKLGWFEIFSFWAMTGGDQIVVNLSLLKWCVMEACTSWVAVVSEQQKVLTAWVSIKVWNSWCLLRMAVGFKMATMAWEARIFSYCWVLDSRLLRFLWPCAGHG